MSDTILKLLAKYWPDRLPNAHWHGKRIVHVHCLCEKHPDRTPSVAVYTDRDRFKCYSAGCDHRGGINEVIELIKSHYKRKNEDININLHEKSEDKFLPSHPSWKWSTPPYVAELITQACRYYQACLWQSEEALAYLHSRGMRDETIRLMGLGWCNGEEDIEKLSKTLNTNVIHLAAAGLITASGRQIFARRIVFPILRASSEYASYAVGRAIDPDREPRYIGLGSSLAKRCPYRIGSARQGVIIVEGIMDAAALIQANAHQDYAVIAMLGAGRAQDWLALARWLKKHHKPCLLMLDRDQAGYIMAQKIGNVFRQFGVSCFSWHAGGEEHTPFIPFAVQGITEEKDLGDVMKSGKENLLIDYLNKLKIKIKNHGYSI